MARKKRITYEQVDAGLNRYPLSNRLPVVTPAQYIMECKRQTGVADWKLAHDITVDSGVEVSRQVVYLWRRKAEKNGN